MSRLGQRGKIEFPVSHRRSWPPVKQVEGCDVPDDFEDAPEQVQPEWQESVRTGMARVMTLVIERQRTVLRLEHIETKIDAIAEKLESTKGFPSIIAPITTFAPEPFEVLKDIKVVIEFNGDEY